MNKIYNSRVLTAVLSLLLALILFLFVKTENYRDNPISYFTNVSEVSTETIYNVPVYIEGDVQDYYVTGLPEAVSVELTGPRNIIEQTLESDEFRVVTEDLTDIGVGNHYIQLNVDNISENIDYQISPSSVNISVEELQSQLYDVEVIADEGQLAEGYEITDISVSPEQVSLIGSNQNISRITSVTADVRLPENVDESFTTEASVMIRDENGDILDVSTDPERVSIEVNIAPIGKDVPVNVVQQNPEENIEYSIENVTPSTVQVLGPVEALDMINQVDALVDLSGITSDSTQTATIDTSQLPEGVTVNQNSVQVGILASSIEETSNQSNASPSSSSSASNSSNNETSGNEDAPAESSEVETPSESGSSSEQTTDPPSNESSEVDSNTPEDEQPSSSVDSSVNNSTAASTTEESAESDIEAEASAVQPNSLLSWFWG